MRSGRHPFRPPIHRVRVTPGEINTNATDCTDYTDFLNHYHQGSVSCTLQEANKSDIIWRASISACLMHLNRWNHCHPWRFLIFPQFRLHCCLPQCWTRCRISHKIPDLFTRKGMLGTVKRRSGTRIGTRSFVTGADECGPPSEARISRGTTDDVFSSSIAVGGRHPVASECLRYVLSEKQR